MFIPARNEADLDDVPAEVLDALNVKPMTDVAEMIAQALEPVAQAAVAAAWPLTQLGRLLHKLTREVTPSLVKTCDKWA